MKRSDYILIIILLAVVFNISLFTINSSLAIEEVYYTRTDIINYNSNEEQLYNNIYNFIDTNDNLLIGLSNYETSENLNDNYDYIVDVAINYILDNINNYQNKITNNYINIEEIYKITDNFFGKNNFYIEETENNKIKLISNTRRFKMNIKNLNIININNNEIKINVEYTNEYTTISYQYILEIIEDKVIIKNIEVLE